MNNENSNTLWAYIHGELNTDERAGIERALQNDPVLRSEEKEIRRLDNCLRKLMPLAVKTEEELEQTVLDAWERSPEALEFNRQQSRLSLIVNDDNSAGWELRGTWKIVLAAAACLIVVFSGYLVSAPPALEWSEPNIAGPAVLRGTGKTVDPLYSAVEFKNFSVELGTALKTAYDETISQAGRKAWFRTKSDWNLRSRFQELRGGNFVVEIAAFEPGKTVALKEWTQYFCGREDYSSSMASFAGLVARDLCEMKAK